MLSSINLEQEHRVIETEGFCLTLGGISDKLLFLLTVSSLPLRVVVDQRIQSSTHLGKNHFCVDIRKFHYLT